MTSRKENVLICMCNEVSKTIWFERLQCWYYWWEGLNEVWCYGGLKWHYILVHTKFHDDLFMGSTNIQVISSTIREAAVLVLLMGWLNEVCHWDGLRHMIYIPSFMVKGSGIQVILWLLPQKFERLQYWYYWWEGFMKYAVEMDSGDMMYIPSFIKIV
jgi:hypothetical protein